MNSEVQGRYGRTLTFLRLLYQLDVSSSCPRSPFDRTSLRILPEDSDLSKIYA